MADPDTHATLADALVKRGEITREELETAQQREAATGTPWLRQLSQMKNLSYALMEDLLKWDFHSKERKQQQSLGDALVKLKALTPDQLNTALAEQKKTGRLLGDILIDKGYVTRKALGVALSKQYGLEFLPLDETPSDIEALEAVPESMARKNAMLPIRLDGDKITVLIADPQARTALRDVSVQLAKRIHPILTSTDDIRKEIKLRYAEAAEVEPLPAPTYPKEESPVSVETNLTPAEDSNRFQAIAQEASGAPVVKLVNTIIQGAANSGATDIHLDPQEPETRVRYRIDGVLHDVMSIDPETSLAVISRLKILSDMDITETRHPQDGHISDTVNDMEYDIRVATLPTFFGERVVLRLLDQSSVLSGIKDLGLETDDQKKLTEMISQPYGMILVTGPTGSGKTTTLYAALNQKNVMTDSIVTLEDPVEYQLSGINQVEINTDIDLTFASTLRAALRQDIDVLLVGEIRDPETARIAVRAAMTGHLVFSTLHTNDAPEAISTLRNMGVPSFLMSSALTGVLAQRLVRKICPNCKTSFTPDKAMLKSLRLPETVKKLYRGKGCENCYHTGSKGRTGIFEVLAITPAVRKLIADEAPVNNITKTAKLRTMADRCRLKVKNGIVEPKEFLKVIRT